jgi:HSP20 family protein
MNVLQPSRMRLSIWPEVDTLQNRLERLFGADFPRFAAETPMQWIPAVDMKETEEAYVLTAELPGMTEQEVDLEVEENVLTIKGEKRSEREEKKEKNGHWHLVERSYGSFARSFTLPPAVDAGKIKAEFTNGVLTVHVPKRKEAAARRIAIGAK